MLADVCKILCDTRRVFRGSGGSWTAGEVDEGVGLALVTGCGQDEDIQTDLAPFGGAVFVDLESATLGGAFYVLNLAVFQNDWLSAVLTNRARGLERQHQYHCYEEKCLSHGKYSTTKTPRHKTHLRIFVP